MGYIVKKDMCVGAVIVGYKHGHCRIGRLSWENYQTLADIMYCFYRPNYILNEDVGFLMQIPSF